MSLPFPRKNLCFLRLGVLLAIYYTNGGADYTELSSLRLYGESVHKTNMSELKKSG